MAKVFEWDAADDEEGNVAHIARHGVTPEEAEEVIRSPRSRPDRSRSSTYPITFGTTKAGRTLAVVWFARGDNPEVIRVVTAFDVEDNRPKGPGGRR